MTRIRLTADGLRQLEVELAQLQQERRPAVAERIRQAREQSHGDAVESTSYDEAKTEAVLVEARITELQRLLAQAEVLEPTDQPYAAVTLGAQVEARDDEGEIESFLIVDPVEANPRQGRISHHSPVGQALLGHRPGEEVEFETPAGRRRLHILAIH